MNDPLASQLAQALQEQPLDGEAFTVSVMKQLPKQQRFRRINWVILAVSMVVSFGLLVLLNNQESLLQNWSFIHLSIFVIMIIVTLLVFWEDLLSDIPNN